MSGRVPPSSRAGRPDRSIQDHPHPDVRRAAKLAENFKGMDAESLGSIKVPALPSVVAVIGECDGVLYTTERDGRQERYIHEFASKDKPLLCVSPDGRQLLLVGGRFVFTDRGIVDLSDTKNLPASLRGLSRKSLR